MRVSAMNIEVVLLDLVVGSVIGLLNPRLGFLFIAIMGFSYLWRLAP